MKVPSFGAKSRRDTGRTANTQKIAKARSLNTISAAGAGSSFTAQKDTAHMHGDGGARLQGQMRLGGGPVGVPGGAWGA